MTAESDRQTLLPFVLLVGNHSSGKSSFVNYLTGRNVQTAGVAPTDDCFTIIAPGAVDRDQDGLAVTTDPDLGFRGLQHFGPALQHHTKLKLRTGLECQNFMLVDSPGMIDAPAVSSALGMVNANNDKTMDRGYDFTGVVRWYATRADIVLLFFDPDKPGTTGETLDVLLHALSGMDHKLLILLNKADQLDNIHDFARAYGSLCWNLSKVMPRKDLPPIFTTCLPTPKPLPPALQDLVTARDQVVATVQSAPTRRMDNLITHLHVAVSQLRMHAVVLHDIRSRYTSKVWRHRGSQLGLATLGTVLTAAVMGTNDVLAGVLCASTILGTGGLVWYQATALAAWQQQHDILPAAFARTHAQALRDGDEAAAAVWAQIRAPLSSLLTQHETDWSRLGVSKANDLQQLEDILEKEIPELRRSIAPPYYGKD